jgi:hypothetical protein
LIPLHRSTWHGQKSHHGFVLPHTANQSQVQKALRFIPSVSLPQVFPACTLLPKMCLNLISLQLERQRISLEKQEQTMNTLASQSPALGYPWSRKEETRAQAVAKGWRTVFAGGRSLNDPSLKREFVLACIAKDLIENEGWFLAFDEVQLVFV